MTPLAVDASISTMIYRCGLDTGGYNWGRLYRFLDADTMRFAEVRRV